jgi:hypothetical protein
MLWTLAMLSNFLSSASVFNSKSFSISMVSNTAQLPANIQLMAWANCITTNLSLSLWPEVLDWLPPITSRPRQNLASPPTACGIIENMLQATLARSVYFECISCCWHHQ